MTKRDRNTDDTNHFGYGSLDWSRHLVKSIKTADKVALKTINHFGKETILKLDGIRKENVLKKLSTLLILSEDSKK